MIVALDVDYKTEAQAAAVVFANWASPTSSARYTSIIQNPEPYESGQFFKRELPCLLSVLGLIPDVLSHIIIDGYVTLADGKPGLGKRLYDVVQIPVIGVGKTAFHDAKDAVSVVRNAAKPLYVTSVGLPVQDAARLIQGAHGPYRLPTMIKLADTLARAR
jgi:deoxyribonuclease V